MNGKAHNEAVNPLYPISIISHTHTHTDWPAHEAPWGTVIKWRLIWPGLKWTSVKHSSWFRQSVTLSNKSEKKQEKWDPNAQIRKKTTAWMWTYLAGITTVIGTLNRGPHVGAAVSYPHTWEIWKTTFKLLYSKVILISESFPPFPCLPLCSALLLSAQQGRCGHWHDDTGSSAPDGRDTEPMRRHMSAPSVAARRFAQSFLGWAL